MGVNQRGEAPRLAPLAHWEREAAQRRVRVT